MKGLLWGEVSFKRQSATSILLFQVTATAMLTAAVSSPSLDEACLRSTLSPCVSLYPSSFSQEMAQEAVSSTAEKIKGVFTTGGRHKESKDDKNAGQKPE